MKFAKRNRFSETPAPIEVHDNIRLDDITMGKLRLRLPGTIGSGGMLKVDLEPVGGDSDNLRDTEAHSISKEPERDCHSIFSGDE